MKDTYLTTCPNGHSIKKNDTLCPECGTCTLREPVKAHPQGRAGNPARTALMGALLLAVIAASVWAGMLIANHSRGPAHPRPEDSQRPEAGRNGGTNEKQREAGAGPRKETGLPVADERQRYFSALTLAQWAWQDLRVDEAKNLLEQHRPGQHRQPDLPGFEFRYLWRFADQARGTLRGHEGPVQCVVVSPDGQHLASAGQDGSVRIWDTKTRKMIGKLAMAAGVMRHSLAFSPDGKWLAGACRSEHLVRVWNVQTARSAFVLRAQRPEFLPAQASDFLPSSVLFSPDGKHLAASTHTGSIYLWDLEDRKDVSPLLNVPGLKDMAFRPRGKELVTVCHVGTVSVWNVENGAKVRTLERPMNLIRMLGLDASGTRCVGMSLMGGLQLWEVDTGKEIATLNSRLFGQVHEVAFSPNGKRMAGLAFDSTLQVWDLEEKSEPATLTGHTNIVHDVAFSGNGLFLASASADGTVRLWKPLRGGEALVLSGNRGAVTGLAFHPSGQRLATIAEDNTVGLWDLKSKRRLHTLAGPGKMTTAVTFSPNGRLLAALADNGTVPLWDAETGKDLGALPGPDFQSEIDWNRPARLQRLAFSPDGKRLAVPLETAPGRTGFRVWDIESRKPVLTITRDALPIQGIAWRPDGRHLALTSPQRVMVVDADSGQEVFNLSTEKGGARDLAYRPDGKRLAGVSVDGRVLVWDADSGKQLFSLESGGQDIRQVVYSPDGQRLATVGQDRTVRLWDAETGQQALLLGGRSRPLTAAAFSPDGQRLATACQDLTVCIWEGPRPEKPAP